MVRKVRCGNASVNAGVLLIRHGPRADLLVFHASRTLTAGRRTRVKLTITRSPARWLLTKMLQSSA